MSTTNEQICEHESATCMECDLEVAEDHEGIQCEDCNMWWHTQCLGITERDYRFIVDHPQFHWFCHQCNVFVELRLRETQEVHDLKVRLLALESQIGNSNQGHPSVCTLDGQNVVSVHDKAIEELATKLEKLDTEIRRELHNQEVALLDVKASMPKIKEDFRELLDERVQRIQRACNIVIFNVPESNRETGSLRKGDDKAKIVEIFNLMSLGLFCIDPVIRLGRYMPGRARPIRISVPNVQTKQAILSAGRDLVFSFSNGSISLPNVKLTPDRTIAEREQMRNRAAERRAVSQGNTNSMSNLQARLTPSKSCQRGTGNESPNLRPFFPAPVVLNTRHTKHDRPCMTQEHGNIQSTTAETWTITSHRSQPVEQSPGKGSGQAANGALATPPSSI